MIIPCLYENCILPPNLSFYFVLNYQRSGKLYNFWDKLKQSIQNTPAESLASLPANPRITITEVDSPQTPKVPALTGAKCNDKTLADSETPTHPIYNSTKPIFVLKKSYSPEPQRKIMPPPQKLRTVSMWELSTQASPESGKDSNSSPRSLKDTLVSPSNASASKKGKWYKKLLTPSIKKTSESGSSVDDDAISTGSTASNGKEKSKKRWFTKKKIAIAL